MSHFEMTESPLESFSRLGERLGVELFVKRDDLLPFPLAGNKVRKLFAEAAVEGWTAGDVLVTNGSLDSNHCRTVALMAAKIGARAHLVMHGQPNGRSPALRLVRSLGATVDVVPSTKIAEVIAARSEEYRERGCTVRIIAGGAHTRAGVEAYRDVGLAVFEKVRPAHVVVASGTGATQAGLHIAGVKTRTPVTGISVARGSARGIAAIREAIEWVEPSSAESILFDDRFVDGGYGQATTSTSEVVSLAWEYGLPIDCTYTGKALRGLMAMIDEGRVAQGDRVLFWHTGGLMNHLAMS